MATPKTIHFVNAKPRDIRALASWRRALRNDPRPLASDTVEFATVAFRRWREAKAKRSVASSIQDLKERIQDNPHTEAALLILAKARWWWRGTLVGLCYFRRTWCNNVCIDFLTAHPLLANNPEAPIRGIGSALLYYVANVAESLGCQAIWLEATQNSASFYSELFGKNIRDLIYLTREEYVTFIRELEERSLR